MMVSPDRGELRSGLPVPAGLSAEAGRSLSAFTLIDPPVARRRKRYAIPVLLVAGWGGLFAYCAAYLREDLPFRPAPPAGAGQQAGRAPRPAIVLPDMEDEPVRAIAQAAPPAAPRGDPAEPSPAITVQAAQTPSSPAVPPKPASAPPNVEYAGIWGPTAAACGRPSRRRGYLPATITADRARAGRTLCTFHDGRRSGGGWLLAADCSDRGRRWSSQVRLVVEGDRLTWTSSRGTASYTRCARRAG